MPVALRIALIALLALLFLAISFFLARWLTADNRERNYVTELLTHQADGDSQAMLAMMPGCAREPSCRQRTASLARRFAGGGDVDIVRYDSATARALGSEEGPTRVAWKFSDPTARVLVQCVTVTRSGVAFLGGNVKIDSIGAPIHGESACPA